MSNRGVATRRHDVRRRVVEQAQRASARKPDERRRRARRRSPRYIADMTAQLESMATAANLDLLAYFLAMARAESEAASHVGSGAAGEDAPSG